MIEYLRKLMHQPACRDKRIKDLKEKNILGHPNLHSLNHMGQILEPKINVFEVRTIFVILIGYIVKS